MVISRKFLLVLCLLLALGMTRAVNGTRPFVAGEDSTSEKPTEGAEELGPLTGQRLEVYELSETEQLIADELKKKRAESAKGVLEVNPRISGAIRYEMQVLFDEESAGLTPEQVEERLGKIVSYLGGTSFVAKEESADRLVDELNQSEVLQKELQDTANLTLALALAEAPDGKRTYCIVYLCKYSIEWRLSRGDGYAGGMEPDSPMFNRSEINGRSNAKFLKYDFYQDRGLPFPVERDSVETNVLETDKEGNFSIRISYWIYGRTEQRRLAVLARGSSSDGYSLVDILSIKGLFPQQD